ncbi:MAG: mechanosensitive ion channel family protein [Nannocystaceae bacterium]
MLSIHSTTVDPLDLEAFYQAAIKWLKASAPGFLADVLAFFVILLLGKFLIAGILRVLRSVIRKSKRASELIERFILNVAHKVLWVLVLMVGLSKLGIDMGPMIAGLGVGGFIIGFAFQETLGNFAAGMMLIINEPFKVGDYIEAAGAAGSVSDVNIMASTLTTADNRVITIPNRKVWGDKIVNFSAMELRRLDLVIGISYSADIERAVKTIEGLLDASAKVVADPEPVVAVNELADSAVNLVVRPWCGKTDYWPLRFELMRGIKEAFDSEGIEIPFPQVDLHVKKGGASL